MFGTYRTILAILVALAHLGISNKFNIIGNYSVFGFYILSGYLMTLILQRNYGYSLKGVLNYLVNRFLRIYPLYWFSIGCTLILIFFLGPVYVSHFHGSMFVPESTKAVFSNVFIFFFPSHENPRLTPPAWALSVELLFYLAIGIGISRTKLITFIWWVLSISYHVIVNIIGLEWDYLYSYFIAASLPFSTGAMIYFYKDKLFEKFKFLKENALLPISLLVLLLNLYVGSRLGTLKSISFYINFLTHSIIIVTLIPKPSLSLISKGLDAKIGELSYPIYLLHYQVGLLCAFIFYKLGYAIQRPHILLFLVSLPVIIIVSQLTVIYINNRIELIRNRIKNG